MHSAVVVTARDEVVRLGPDRQIVAIASHPADPRPDAPGVIILNAGVLHRVGPHRLHVTIARELAMRGIRGLRLDLGGIGDSTSTSDATTFRETAVADTCVAVAAMAAAGAPSSVIFGICAGADNALATALVDSRVAGIVLVDPHAYANLRGRVRNLRARLESQGVRSFAISAARATLRVVRARIEKLRRPPNASADEPDSGGREAPPIEEFRRQLTTLVERGVRVLAIYSGAHGAAYNHADQLFELFPELRGRIQCAYFAHANHTFTELAAQRELVATVVDWIANRH